MTFALRYAARSDVGLVRSNNQDSGYAGSHLVAVADGMAARGFGRIVNITSAAVKAPIPELGLSNGARAGLTGLVGGVARQIAANAGEEGSVIVNAVINSDKPRYGFNAATGEYVDDMVAAGIVDPAKVTRTALQNAASIGALILTTEAIVSDKPEKAAPAPAAGGDMGGMGGMDF